MRFPNPVFVALDTPDLPRALSLAAAAIGADGLLIEVHPRPEEALSDGAQSVTLEQFAALTAAVRPVHDQASSLHAPRGGAIAAAGSKG